MEVGGQDVSFFFFSPICHGVGEGSLLAVILPGNGRRLSDGALKDPR